MKIFEGTFFELEENLINEYLMNGDLTKENNFENFCLNVGCLVQTYIEENYEFEYTKDGIIKRML